MEISKKENPTSRLGAGIESNFSGLQQIDGFRLREQFCRLRKCGRVKEKGNGFGIFSLRTEKTISVVNLDFFPFFNLVVLGDFRR